MSRLVSAGVTSLSTIVCAVALSCSLGAVAFGATPPPTDGPITVVVPSTASPSPSPSSTGGGGGGSTGGSGETPDDDGSGGGTSTCAAKNADGSPVPPASPTEDALDLDINRDRLTAGEWVITRSSDFTRGEKAQVVLYPGAVVIGSFTVDAPTGFAARFRIPEGTLVGQYTLEATGWNSCVVANNGVTIVSGPAPAPAPASWWPLIVVGSLGFGLLSLLIAFRADIALWFAAAAPGPTP